MRISTKLSLFLLFASLVPLLLFGLISLWQLKKTTALSVIQGNANVSRRAAEQIDQYVKNALSLLEATTQNINHADLKDWQKERILKNYTNRFNEFNEITVWNLQGQVSATSRLGDVKMDARTQEAFQKAREGRPYLSSVYIKEDLSPAILAAYPIYRLTETSEVLVAELNLLEMWHLVDSIRIGKSGILHVIESTGLLIATGDGRRKMDVFQQRSFEPAGKISAILSPQGAVFQNPFGEEVLAVGIRLQEPMGWTVLVEEPTAEAYALATKIGYLLAGIMGAILLIALIFGYYAGKRQVVDPISILSHATEELARGNLDYRISLKTGDEFEWLGQAFNQMAVRLKELQETLIREERHAMFGKIASGLAHDLKHPIQAIETSSRLMEKLYDDAEYRTVFRKTVEREFAKVNLFLQNLHNLTHEVPHHPAPIKVPDLVEEALATFEPEAQKQGIEVVRRFPQEPLWIRGDAHGLNRVLSNLISNALQAMGRGGRLVLSVVGNLEHVAIEVQDTGMGIPPERIKTLFEDFVTTKRHGLGLGLAITRKIVSQHQGRIEVFSQVGQGTTFKLSFPVLKEGGSFQEKMKTA